MQDSINNQSMLKVGTILHGTYRIDSYLSSGGFGNTYVATNIEFDERVAIKEFFMKGVTQRDDNQTTVSVSNSENTNSFFEQREKFKKEARRIRQLHNEHIVAVHDLFEENGTAYYVMDFVDGENLAERLKRTGKPMTESEVSKILPQILDALKAVHDAGFCHLDIKPSNIMLEKGGKVKLIDFGASKQLGSNGTLTTNAPTAFAQTPGYAPREQIEQSLKKIGPWTDIYALGATLYNLLTNKRPPQPMDIDDDSSEDKHVALSFPKNVGDMRFLILKMMRTNRLQRPQSIDAIGYGKSPNKEPVAETHNDPNSNFVEITWNMNDDDEETIIADSKQQVKPSHMQSNESKNKEPDKNDGWITPPYMKENNKKDLMPFGIVLIVVSILISIIIMVSTINVIEKKYSSSNITQIEETVDTTASPSIVYDDYNDMSQIENTIDSIAVPVVIEDGYYEYIGYFEDSNGKIPIKLSFVLQNGSLQNCIYTNSELGGKIRLSGYFEGCYLRLFGKDGNQAFNINLQYNTIRSLNGNASVGDKLLGASLYLYDQQNIR